jgi:hypothetical protein
MKRKDIQPQEDLESNDDRFQSDTQKIVRRHLENEEDVITEEDIANVRVGMTPPLDEATEEAIKERDRSADRKKTDDDDASEGQKATPWDVIDSDE